MTPLWTVGATSEAAAVRLVTRGVAGAPREIRRPELPADAPVVSCLMVTRDRAPLASLAVECFRRQTYPKRELVIIDDGPDDKLARMVAGLADERIRMVRRRDRSETLGGLRNLAVGLASGQLICQWDDDDLSDPDRLWWQVGVLTESAVSACFLERWTMLWTRGPRVAIGRRRLWEGSLVAHRAALPTYPPERRGEDSAVAQALVGSGTVVLLDLPSLYVYVIHGRNTFDGAHFDAHWEAASHRFEDPQTALTTLQHRVPASQTIALAAPAGG